MNDIWLREQERRKALWQLADLMPGDRGAQAVLKRLEELERLDHDAPISIRINWQSCLEKLIP